MAEPYIGEIRAFAFGYTPLNWLSCDGSQQAISQFTALYNVIATRFGGDAKTYFNLPDLRARAVASQYTTGTIPPYMQTNNTVGSIWGQNAVSLTENQLPSHTHVAKGYGSTSGVTQVGTPDGTTYLGLLRNSGAAAGTYDVWSTNAANDQFSPSAVGQTGGASPTYASAAHNNNQPYLPLNFCICYDGNYPARP